MEQQLKNSIYLHFKKNTQTKNNPALSIFFTGVAFVTRPDFNT